MEDISLHVSSISSTNKRIKKDFVDHFCFLCHVFLMLLHLFIAALWSPVWKGLASWLLLVMFIVFVLLSYVVYWVGVVLDSTVS